MTDIQDSAMKTSARLYAAMEQLRQNLSSDLESIMFEFIAKMEYVVLAISGILNTLLTVGENVKFPIDVKIETKTVEQVAANWIKIKSRPCSSKEVKLAQAPVAKKRTGSANKPKSSQPKLSSNPLPMDDGPFESLKTRFAGITLAEVKESPLQKLTIQLRDHAFEELKTIIKRRLALLQDQITHEQNAEQQWLTKWKETTRRITSSHC